MATGFLLFQLYLVESGLFSLLAGLACPWTYVLKIILAFTTLGVSSNMNKICTMCLLPSLGLWYVLGPWWAALGSLTRKML